MTETIDEAVAAIDLINRLTARALEIVDKAPYWKFVSEPELATLDIDGDDALLRLVSAESDWDVPKIVVEVVKFPAALLFIGHDELTAWKQEQAAIYERQQAEQQEANRQAREAQERATLAALQRKYGLSE